MILYPAIDLKGGKAVRLLRGDMATAKVFNEDPADQARRFAEAGFEWLHLVDLDGAVEGKPVNRRSVEAILESVSLPAQLGGGIRDLKSIEGWLEAGVVRVILGTVAVKNPQLVQEACRLFPGRIVVGIDARGGRVAVEGWVEESDISAEDLALRFEDAGVTAIVFTRHRPRRRPRRRQCGGYCGLGAADRHTGDRFRRCRVAGRYRVVFGGGRQRCERHHFRTGAI